MKIAFVIPGELDQPTGGYQYDLQIVTCWQRANRNVEIISLPGDYPFPDKKSKQAALDIASGLEGFDCIVVDGLAGGSFPDLLKKLSKLGPVVSLVHHPLCLENGLSEDQQTELKRNEGAGLAFVCGVITTSTATAETVIELFGYDKQSIKTVEPGVKIGNIAEPWNGGAIKLLCVASLIERKGHKYLIEALSTLVELNWELDCYGSDLYDPVLSKALLSATAQNQLDHRIRFHGSVDQVTLEKAYTKAHIFVLPSLYEGYGMVLSEAIVHGLPIISTNAGAIPTTVPEGCGILVPPTEAAPLADALRRLIEEQEFRQTIRQNAIAAAASFKSWEQSADQFLNYLKSFQ